MTDTKAPETSLADLTVDTTPPRPAPADFNLQAFIRGVRPTRRSVKLYPQADLVGQLEKLADRIEQLPDGPEVDALIDQAIQLQEIFHAGGVWWTVEKRSSEWVKNHREKTAAALGLASTETERAKMQLMLHQLAAQIVEPAGVTAEDLHALYEANEGEVSKLIVALTMVNEQVAEAAKVVSLDFSQRRSGRTGGLSRN